MANYVPVDPKHYTPAVGDRVMLERGYQPSITYEIQTVAKVTPKGRIKTVEGYEFTPDGHTYPHSNGYHVPRLVPYTEKRAEEAERKDLAFKLSAALERKKADRMTLDRLRVLSLLIDAPEEAIAEMAPDLTQKAAVLWPQLKG